jgi:tetratricopeptide (TPR) repeat protein
MNRYRLFVVSAATIVTATMVAGQTAMPRNFLNEGIAAFKAAKYTEAVELFQQAVNASPANPVAHLYLGTAWMSQFIPGADNPQNMQFAAEAEREFQAVLALQPDNLVAMESLASLHYNRAQGNRTPTEKLRAMDEAAYWYRNIVSAHPDNKTAHYSLGVIAWAKFYPELMQVRQKLGMRPEDPGPLSDAAVRADLRSRMGASVDEGMRHLERALELDPAYDDAMAYLNLLYRERADLYDTAAEYQRDVAIADTWVQRAL